MPVALVFGVIFMQQGMPMTYASTEVATTLEPGSMGLDDKGQAKPQTIVVGPVAAVIPIKMLGTNGGGFYGMNSAHPLENPTATSNFFTTLAMMIFPFSLVLMYGRMLGRIRHSVVIYGVMLAMMIGLIVWVMVFDTMQPNPGLTAHAGATYQIANPSAPSGKIDVVSPPVAALPVDQHLGNLEGKELRFGTSAGAAFAAITTDVTCGAINAEMDSLNPLAGLSPMIGMWVNCVFGGKGVGMINLLLFLIVGVFLAGQMVGRTPEYLGRKVGAREMKLAMIALLVHPILILGPSGLFAATSWGTTAEANPGAHGFSEIVYQYSSASANNGSAFDGLGVTYGLQQQPQPVAGSGSVGHRHRPRDAVQPLPADHRADRDGLLARTQEDGAGHARHDERRHLDVRLPAAGHDRGRRRASVPAGRGARTSGRASRADPIRRLIPPRHARSAALSRASPLELRSSIL